MCRSDFHTYAPLRASVMASAAMSVLILSGVAFAGTDSDTSSTQTTVLSGVNVTDKAPVAKPVSKVGKPDELTDSSDLKTLQTLQIDSLSDYARRVDAGISYNANTKSINIQGLDENRVLTTIDGVQIPWLYDGARGVQGGVSTYDFDSISKVDVVKSADSSAFGTGALGGTLSLATLDPDDLLAEGHDVGGLSKVLYNGADHSWYGGQAFAGRIDDTSFLIQASYKSGHELQNMGKTGGTGSTRTDKNPADNEEENLLLKVYQRLPGGHKFGITGEIYSDDYNEDTLTSVGSTYDAYQTQTLNKRRRVLGTYDYQAPGESLIDNAHIGIYFQRTDLQINTNGDRTTSPAGAYIRDSDLREEDSGINATASSGFVTDYGNHAVSYGLTFKHSLTTQYAYGKDNCTSAIYACHYYHVDQSDMPAVNSNEVGAFVQDEISFPGSHIRVTPGVRFDWYQRDPTNTAAYQANDGYISAPETSSSSRLSPKIMVSWDAAKKLTFFAQWSQAFRAPSATELYVTYGAEGSYVSIGNPDLKAETSNGFVVGAKAGDDRLGGKITFYDNYYRNFIDNITTTADAAGLSGSYPYGVFEYVNRDQVHIYGGDIEAHWRFTPHWKTWASLVYSDGKDTKEDEHLNSIPPLKGILGIGYSTDVYGADLSATMAGNRHKVEDSSSDLNRTPGYAVFDISGWWKLPRLDGLMLKASVNNLFNTTYYDALDLPDSATISKAYYTQPGRNAKVALVYRF